MNHVIWYQSTLESNNWNHIISILWYRSYDFIIKFHIIIFQQKSKQSINVQLFVWIHSFLLSFIPYAGNKVECPNYCKISFLRKYARNLNYLLKATFWKFNVKKWHYCALRLLCRPTIVERYLMTLLDLFEFLTLDREVTLACGVELIGK